MNQRKDHYHFHTFIKKNIRIIVFIEKNDLKSLIKISADFSACEAVCFSCDPYVKKIENVMIYPWRIGIEKFFGDTEL